MEVFNKNALRELGNDVESVLRDLGERHNITFRWAGGSFSHGESVATMKLEVTLNDTDLKSYLEIEYDRYADIYKLPPFGTIVSYGGTHFKMIGFKSRNRKYPIIAENMTTGKKYKFPDTFMQIATIV
jgi:hypothetical protein